MRIGVLTGGGDAPGLNAAIRAVARRAFQLGHQVSGVKNGWAGCLGEGLIDELKPADVRGILPQGGTILGTSRTNPLKEQNGIDRVIRALRHNGIDALVTIGGDDTLSVAAALHDAGFRTVGVPKTIDNDVGFVSRTFGFFSAIEEAKRVLDCAHTEARSVPGGIGLVKLMGRHAGFITAGAVVASQDVNFALIPEVPFALDSFLAALKRRMLSKSHAVIAVAEGAGQNLLAADATERDASGNVKLRDIGPFLRERIETYFKAEGIPVVMRYFDPSYQVRSRPANCEDALLCDLFARYAVHAAMAGKTGVVIGFLHERFIHVPIEQLAAHTKRLDPASGWWRSVLAATGQPERFS